MYASDDGALAVYVGDTGSIAIYVGDGGSFAGYIYNTVYDVTMVEYFQCM